MKSDFKPVVRNKRTNDFYFYNGGNSFTNIRTQRSGEVSDEDAKRTFSINTQATVLINDYPIVAKMIAKLGLVFEQNK